MKNALRSGDIWVQGSRQFKDFEDYLVPPAKFASPQAGQRIAAGRGHRLRPVPARPADAAGNAACHRQPHGGGQRLPDAIITESGLKITPLDAAVPDTAQALIDQTAMILPHVKITELLLEVDEWTGFTRHFTHLKPATWPRTKPAADDDPWPTRSIWA